MQKMVRDARCVHTQDIRIFRQALQLSRACLLDLWPSQNCLCLLFALFKATRTIDVWCCFLLAAGALNGRSSGRCSFSEGGQRVPTAFYLVMMWPTVYVDAEGRILPVYVGQARYI